MRSLIYKHNFEKLQQQISNPILIQHNENADRLSESIIKEIEEKNDEQQRV